MIGKLLEAFFRHKLLILLPPLLIPLIAGAIAFRTSRPTYESWAGIWVERPTYLKLDDEINRFNTPAQIQSDRLGQMIRTRSFLIAVAQRTTLAPLVGSEQGEEEMQRLLQRDLAIFTNGANLVSIRYRATAPELPFQVVNAVIEAFKDRANADRSAQADVALSFYGSRLQDAQDKLAKSTEELRRYVNSSPRARTADPSRGAAQGPTVPTAADPQLADLQNTVDLDQKEVERSRAAFEQAQIQATAAREGQEIGFRVVDPPRISTRGTVQYKQLAVYPAVGLVFGLALSTVLLVLLVAADRSARSEADLAAVASVIGIVPELKPKYIPRRGGLDAARRAIGFVAGAPSPAQVGAK